jgi:hypothetical protein
MNQPAAPAVPAFYRAAAADHRRVVRALDFENMAESIMALHSSSWTDEQRAEIDAYNRQVDAYNRWLDEQRAARNAKIEKEQAAARTAKLRAATCSSCFTVHAGECY